MLHCRRSLQSLLQNTVAQSWRDHVMGNTHALLVQNFAYTLAIRDACFIQATACRIAKAAACTVALPGILPNPQRSHLHVPEQNAWLQHSGST